MIIMDISKNNLQYDKFYIVMTIIIANSSKLFFYTMINIEMAKSNWQYNTFLYSYDYDYSK